MKTYRLGPSPATHSTPPVSFGAESQACRTGAEGEGERTCGGGFLPLPEEEEENMFGFRRQWTRGKKNAVLHSSTHGRCWFRSLDRAPIQCSRLPRDTHTRPQRCDCSNARLLELGFAVGC